MTSKGELAKADMVNELKKKDQDLKRVKAQMEGIKRPPTDGLDAVAIQQM